MTYLEATAAAASGPPRARSGAKPLRLSAGELRLVRATSANFEQIEAWAAAEGWNPGRGDAAVFLRTDPAGHFAGFLGERHVSAINVVNYDEQFAFCGMLLVDPALRGQGLGTATWEAAIGHAADRTVAADVPPHLTEEAEQLGFIADFRTIRFAGQLPPARRVDPHVLPAVVNEHQRQMVGLDAACFPVRRPKFAVAFATAAEHHALAYVDANDNVHGYGVLRPGRGMARIGPLYAERSYMGAAIFDGLCALAADMGAVAVSMDVPAQNPGGRAVAESRGLSHIGEAHRMYRPGAGEPRSIDTDQLYALTCLGLG
ncbi:GNAT family N-acetyltransferase [Catenulispora subtropica]|uniref:Acetyltransferase n=1 Tax=Catenulispora subtropica TaxID=450798 RepID=A0ABN2T842_9ACTN